MALYENEHRKQCAKCKVIKDKQDFGNVVLRGVTKKHRHCNECRASGQLATLEKIAEKKKQKRDHWLNEMENKRSQY